MRRNAGLIASAARRRRAGQVGMAVAGSFDISTTDKIDALPMAIIAEVPLGSLWQRRTLLRGG